MNMKIQQEVVNFEFSRPFVVNEMLLRKIKQPLKKFRLTNWFLNQ